MTVTSLPDDYVHYHRPRTFSVREWAGYKHFQISMYSAEKGLLEGFVEPGIHPKETGIARYQSTLKLVMQSPHYSVGP